MVTVPRKTKSESPFDDFQNGIMHMVERVHAMETEIKESMGELKLEIVKLQGAVITYDKLDESRSQIRDEINSKIESLTTLMYGVDKKHDDTFFSVKKLIDDLEKKMKELRKDATASRILRKSWEALVNKHIGWVIIIIGVLVFLAINYMSKLGVKTDLPIPLPQLETPTKKPLRGTDKL